MWRRPRGVGRQGTERWARTSGLPAVEQQHQTGRGTRSRDPIHGLGVYSVGAFKSELRGHVQDMIEGKNKEQNMQAANLELEIEALEAHCATDGGAVGGLLNRLRLKRYELCDLVEQHARANALPSQRRLYEYSHGTSGIMGVQRYLTEDQA
ncbi:hypothetical protein NDU88_003492 [Pleurodeles waltl]|uniref:Uncharacterized protein n=1 Tax=Pleurodeles waltl TaxID=8319 RepID=A0AAV7PH27_PLEWA|nr:hypothetical protein NDU88_003492 [Pleurodeles waltl]